jgi:septum formation protein
MSDIKKAPLPSEPPPSYDATPLNPASSAPLRLGAPRPPPLDLPALNLLRGRRTILASASPRRRQLLASIGLTNIEIIPSSFEENLPKSASPFEYVLATATEKALEVYKREINNESKGEPAMIIAADTIVVSSSGAILEKPRSEAQHIAMLKSLRDTGVHRVYTAVACMAPLESARDPGYAMDTAVEETAVKFDSTVTDELLLAYVKTREGADKAGGYGIQGTGSILVEKIDGSFDNVVGLPLRIVLKLIEKVVEKSEDGDVLEHDLLGDDEDEEGEEDEG